MKPDLTSLLAERGRLISDMMELRHRLTIVETIIRAGHPIATNPSSIVYDSRNDLASFSITMDSTYANDIDALHIYHALQDIERPMLEGEIVALLKINLPNAIYPRCVPMDKLDEKLMIKAGFSHREYIFGGEMGCKMWWFQGQEWSPPELPTSEPNLLEQRWFRALTTASNWSRCLFG